MLWRFVTWELQGNRISNSKICLFIITMISGWLLLRNSTFGRSFENQLEVILSKRHSHLSGKSSVSGCLPWQKLKFAPLVVFLLLVFRKCFVCLFCFSSSQHLLSSAKDKVLKVVPSGNLATYSVFLCVTFVYKRSTCG